MHDQVRLGAICWLASAQFLLAQLLAHLAAPGQNLFLYDISLLGISSCGVFSVATSGSADLVCSPLHLVFNAGIVIHGALIILGVWLTRSVWPRDRAASAGLTLLALGGTGAMMVGAYPVDDHMILHIVGAVTAIAAPGFGLLLLATSLRHSMPRMARWTAVTGFLVLLAGLGHALGGYPLGRGTMERLAVWPQSLWFIGAGWALWNVHLPARQRPVRASNTRPVWPLRTGAVADSALSRPNV
jgi:hypothetical membrane protein